MLAHTGLGPLGGIFLVFAGFGVMVGAVSLRYSQPLAWLGIAAGVTAATVVQLRTGIAPQPSTLQLSSLAAALALEVVAFAVLMPRLYRNGPRAVAAGTLVIVGTHFIVMTPAFGLPIVILAVACIANAVALWRTPSYRIAMAWFVDGLFKLVAGTVMVMVT